MKRNLIVFLAALGISSLGFSAEKKVEFKDLPPAVQKAVQEQTKGAHIKGISRETEDGVPQYEIETTVNGKSRDINVDTKGNLLVVEEQTSMDAIPAAARAAIEKKAAGAKVTRVETVNEKGVTSYEAAYMKGGKSHEVAVKPDGSLTK